MGWAVEADFFFQVERAQKNPSEPFEPVRLTSVENLPQNPKAIRQWQHTKNKHLAEKALHGKTKSIRKEALKNIHRIVRNLVPNEPSEAIAGKPTAWNQGVTMHSLSSMLDVGLAKILLGCKDTSTFVLFRLPKETHMTSS